MDNPLWIVLILLVVLIAGGIYLLTRNPAPRRSDGPPPADSPQGDDPQTDKYDVGGAHVAAGDADAGPPGAPYDQEVDAGNDHYQHDGETHLEPTTVDETVSQDTATGAEVDIVEEEPVVRSTEDLDPVDAPADPYDHGDREQMTYGDTKTEDYAAETTYATPVPLDADVTDDELDGRSADELMEASGHAGHDAPEHDASEHDELHHGDPVVVNESPSEEVGTQGAPYYGQHSVDGGDESAGGGGDESSGGATVMDNVDDSAHDAGGTTDPAVPDDGEYRADSGHDHHGAGSENLGPEEGEGDADEAEVDQGHPGPASQPGDDATYDGPLTDDEAVENPGPEEGEGDITPAHDQGHPGHDSHRGDEATYGESIDERADISGDGSDGTTEVEEVVIVEDDDSRDAAVAPVLITAPDDDGESVEGDRDGDGSGMGHLQDTQTDGDQDVAIVDVEDFPKEGAAESYHDEQHSHDERPDAEHDGDSGDGDSRDSDDHHVHDDVVHDHEVHDHEVHDHDGQGLDTRDRDASVVPGPGKDHHDSGEHAAETDGDQDVAMVDVEDFPKDGAADSYEDEQHSHDERRDGEHDGDSRDSDDHEVHDHEAHDHEVHDHDHDHDHDGQGLDTHDRDASVDSGEDHHDSGKHTAETDGDQDVAMVDVEDFPATGSEEGTADSHQSTDHEHDDRDLGGQDVGGQDLDNRDRDAAVDSVEDRHDVTEHPSEGHVAEERDSDIRDGHDHEDTAGRDGAHVAPVGLVDGDDRAGSRTAGESQVGLVDDDSTEAMVDREHEEPIDSAAGPDTERNESETTEVVPEEGPYGPGSAMPHDDGSGPSGFGIKGNAGSMLFHTPDSPAYEDCRAEVWFESEDTARAAGFAHWDRKQR